MVITATSIILLGLLGVATATATGYVASEYGDEFGKAIENGVDKAVQDSKEHSPFANMVKYATDVAKGDIGKTIETATINETLSDKQPQKENGNNNDENKNKTPIPPLMPTPGTGTETEQEAQTPSISDESMTNIEQMLNGNSLQEYLTKMRDEQWAREDKIRQETQEREDTAYSRVVRDMWRTGINPNLMNVSPAESGGGITNATGIDYSVYQGEVEKAVKEFEVAINNAFKEEENSKDRITDIVQSGMLLIGVLMGKGLTKSTK